MVPSPSHHHEQRGKASQWQNYTEAPPKRVVNARISPTQEPTELILTNFSNSGRNVIINVIRLVGSWCMGECKPVDHEMLSPSSGLASKDARHERWDSAEEARVCNKRECVTRECVCEAKKKGDSTDPSVTWLAHSLNAIPNAQIILGSDVILGRFKSLLSLTRSWMWVRLTGQQTS